MSSNEELAIITEVGVFGGLNIADPTKKQVQEEDLEALKEAAIKANLENLK